MEETTTTMTTVSTQAAFLAPITTTTQVTADVSDSCENGGGDSWTWWENEQFVGITHHIPEFAYSIDRYCTDPSSGLGDMCWRLGGDQSSAEAVEFRTTILPAFCNRNPMEMIAFGHPDHQPCGQCSQLRVRRRDGKYNCITVMATDHPTDTNTSPELSTSGKNHLDQNTVEGVTCPHANGGVDNGNECHQDDRLSFEYRSVSCTV